MNSEQRRPLWLNAAPVLLVVSSILLGGCQLPLANYLRDRVFPQDTTTKVVMAPVLFPAYAVASIVDVVIINPVRGTKNVPKVVSSVWEWEDEPAWVGKGVLLPVKAVAIPLAALGTVMFSEQFIYEQAPPADATDPLRQ